MKKPGAPMSRIRGLKLATPQWADHKRISKIYSQARIRTRRSGILHVVDHVIPLHGEIVCGLHVHDNLRVITYAANCIKKNRLEEMLCPSR